MSPKKATAFAEDAIQKEVINLTGAMADKLYKLQQKKSAAAKVLKELEEEEKALREMFIDNLPKDSAGIVGKAGKVMLKTSVVPVVEDWPSLHAYIKRTNSFDLLQRRLTKEAVEERWGAKKEIPGVGRFTALKLSVTKV